MLVGIWSNEKGHGKVTTTALSVACVHALETEQDVCIMQTKFKGNDLNVYLMKQPKFSSIYKSFDSNGIDYLIKLSKTNTATKDSVRNASKSLLNRKLHVFSGTAGKSRAVYEEELKETIDGVVSLLRESYDTVFIDINAGDSQVSASLLEECDKLIICVPQNVRIIDDLFMEYRKIIDWSKVILVLTDYDSNSNVTTNYVKRLYGKLGKFKVGTLTHCAELANAVNNSELTKFFLRNIENRSDKSIKAVMSDSRDIIKNIIVTSSRKGGAA